MKLRLSACLAVFAAPLVWALGCESSGGTGNPDIAFEAGSFDGNTQNPDGAVTCAEPPCDITDGGTNSDVVTDGTVFAGPYGDTPPPANTASDVYIDPVNGKDTNTGKIGSPLKTIGKGLATVPSGSAVHLLDGTYNPTSEGPDSTLTVPAGVILRAENYRLATLTGLTVNANGATAGIYGVVFASANLTINPTVVSQVVLSGIQLTSTQLAGTTFTARGFAKVDVHGLDDSGYLPLSGISVLEDAQVVMKGGTIDGQGHGGAGFGAVIFALTGRASLTLDGVTVKSSLTPAIGVNGSTTGMPAHLVLQNGTLFDTVGVAEPNCGAGGVIITGNNARVALDKTTVKGSPNNAICVRAGLDVEIAMNASTLMNNASGIAAETGSGVSAKVTVTGSTIANSVGYGIIWQGEGLITVSNSTVTTNAAAGFFLSGGPNGLTLQLRNTKLTGSTYGLQAYSDKLTLDLGTAASPGNNTITGNTTTGLSISMPAGAVVDAQGNTWNPSIGGADAAGHYTAGTVISDPTNGGTNYQLVNPGTLNL